MPSYFKVLNADGSACHGGSGHWPLPTKNPDGSWTPGEPLAVKGPLMLCTRRALHGCLPNQLVHWLGPTIWRMQFRGEVVDGGDKVGGLEARLVSRVETWDDRTARHFACDCAARVLHLFEQRSPKDTRPRDAIHVARLFADGRATETERAAAWVAAWAARDAAGAAAWAARDAAGAAAGAAGKDAEENVRQTSRLRDILVNGYSYEELLRS